MSISDILQHFLESISFQHILIILQLVILEGLLSFDNAIALAALVRKNIPHEADRKKALMLGIWGAYVLRTGVIFIGVWLMELKWVQVLAGLYLIYLCVHELWSSSSSGQQDKTGPADDVLKAVPPKISRRVFWMTVAQIELLDLMFSIDSVAVALAISHIAWVLICGAILGILLMRFSAQVFIKLIDKFPLLEKAAFLLVGIAGVNLLLKLDHLDLGFTTISINIHIPDVFLFSIMLLIIAFAMCAPRLFKKFPKT